MLLRDRADDCFRLHEHGATVSTNTLSFFPVSRPTIRMRRLPAAASDQAT
jgi:hypothetical protein